MDTGGRLRQRVPVRQPAGRRAAGNGRARSRDLHRHFQQGALSRCSAGIRRRPAGAMGPVLPVAIGLRLLHADALSACARGVSARRDILRGHLRRMRSAYLERRDALLRGLARHCGNLLKIHNSDAGLHVTALLRMGLDDQDVVARLGRRRRRGDPPLDQLHRVDAADRGYCLDSAAPRRSDCWTRRQFWHRCYGRRRRKYEFAHEVLLAHVRSVVDLLRRGSRADHAWGAKRLCRSPRSPVCCSSSGPSLRRWSHSG